MKILVLVTGYPNFNNLYNCAWAHTRNKYYIKKGITVNVVVFDHDVKYCFDGVDVICKSEAINKLNKGYYNLVISHSPNIRCHIPFLEKYCKNIEKTLFMHGTESMKINSDYPKPYDYMKESIVKIIIRNIYDLVKFRKLKSFVINNNDIKLIFVSNWMKNIFEKNIFKLNNKNINNRIINNSLSQSVFEQSYDKASEKIADFVTIRSFDLSKYAIDMVVNFAIVNPDKKIHIYGKGKYFEIYHKPDNITIFDNYINQDEIPKILNNYRAALMPTRCDAQGVMVCEMATFGIPVITSDIDVNNEMFSDFKNVLLLSESKFSEFFDLNSYVTNLNEGYNKDRFGLENTLEKEVSFLYENKKNIIL